MAAAGGLGGKATVAAAGDGAWPSIQVEPETLPAPGDAVEDLETPVLVVDLDRMEANIRFVQAYCERLGVRNRIHIKTHKIPQIAALQVASGVGGNHGAEARRGGGVRRVRSRVRRHLPPLQLARRGEAPPATCVPRTLPGDRVEPHLRQRGRCRGPQHGGERVRPSSQGVGRVRRRAGPRRRHAAPPSARSGLCHRATPQPDVWRPDVVHRRRGAER